MSHQRDLMGQIADARAQMMMRGHDRLVLEMGLSTARRFREESEITDIDDWCDAILGMKIIVRSGIEGFLVRPQSA